MPRTKLQAHVDRMKAPARDPIKALILERLNAEGISLRAFAVELGIHPNTLQTMMKTSTAEWRMKYVYKSCRLLGITQDELRGAIRL